MALVEEKLGKKAKINGNKGCNLLSNKMPKPMPPSKKILTQSHSVKVNNAQRNKLTWCPVLHVMSDSVMTPQDGNGCNVSCFNA